MVCKRCNISLVMGQAIEQTRKGLPDFPGDKYPVTVSPGGPGKLIDCLKCPQCGYSVTAGEEGRQKMGGSANVIVKTRSEQVCLYTHWDGTKLPETLRAAMKRGKERWDDSQYLARIIFCEMVKGDEMGTGDT